MTPPIAIIGAGPSGLLLARYLEINNIDYIVYEKDDGSNNPTLHGTIDIHENLAQEAIKQADLWESFERVGRFHTQVSGIFDHHGEIISVSEKSDLPQIDWKDVRPMMIEAIPEGKIQWHRGVESVEKDSEGKVVITFDDQSVEKDFKLVVGADGTFSKVRHLVMSAKPQYFGITYVRTSISHDSEFWSTMAGRLAPTNFFVIGQRKQLVCQKNVTGTYTVNIGMHIPEDFSESRIAKQQEFRDYLLESEFKHWGTKVRNLVQFSDGEFTLWRHYYMPPDTLCWETVPGVALVGNAAHPALPWPGEALSQALYDSLELGKQIVKHGLDGLTEAVSEYEQLLFPRRKAHTEKTIALGEFFYSRNVEEICEILLAAGE